MFLLLVESAPLWWRGSSAARMDGGNGTGLVFRRGRSQTGPREGQFPIPSVSLRSTSSLPLLAYGHFPLIGGIGPLIRGVVLPYRLQEKLPSLGRGAPWGSRQNCTGSVGSAKAGAAVETLHLQFLQTQGPVARENTRTATQILRAGNFLPGSRDNSRNGVRGKQSYGPRRSEAEP